jgi:hypothetical protein
VVSAKVRRSKVFDRIPENAPTAPKPFRIAVGSITPKRRILVASKARTRPSWKRNTVRYKQQIAPAKTREGQENLQKKKRYANRHG